MVYKPEPILRESVTTRAAQEICRYIEGEGLGAGDLLPTETRLAEMLGVSRNSVREALRMLHGLGFIDKSAGRRAIVKAPGAPGGAPVDEDVAIEAAPVAHEVRALIEQRCAEFAAERMTDEDLAVLERAFAALERAVRRREYVEAVRAHESFHEAILAAAKNPVLLAIFNGARIVNLEHASKPVRKTFGERRHLEQHRAILAALRDRDPQRAAAAVKKHFQTVAPIVEFMTAHAGAAAWSDNAPGVVMRGSSSRSRRSGAREPGRGMANERGTRNG
jgi:GntR family transcriptional repressor for pyruvate dehydrogenase complex